MALDARGPILVAQAGSLAFRSRVEGDTPVTFPDEAAARAWLRRRADGLGAMASIRRAAMAAPSSARLDRLAHDELIERVARALRRGSLAAATALERFAAPKEEVEVSDAPPAVVDEALTWIAIQLLDDGDPQKPIPGETYRLTLPDGTVRTGTLDAQGYALVDGIDPGSCEVTFPNLDASDWHPA